jgi:signal transduction histidine kinase
MMSARAQRALFLGLGLILGWAAVVRAETNLAPTSAPPGVQRLIRGYALTSANDFPERDPQDWRLLGSNDGGETWTALDIRRGEVFPERHQRRVFACANPSLFNMYRLEIDRVHAPTTADAVQLAEIEPIGDPDPAPLFCDQISAQGQNLPAETASQAFDGRADTKWLDFASDRPETRSSWIQWRYLDHRGLALTNFHQLRSLRARADEGYAVHIEATVVGPVPATHQLCLLDETGFLDLTAPGETVTATPGQQILLTGTSQWSDPKVTVRRPVLREVGAPAPQEPRRIQIEQSAGADDELRWVEAEGRAQFVREIEGGLTFDLMDNARRASVRVLHSDPAYPPPAEGASVRVRALCGGILDNEGNRVAGLLWTAGMESVFTVSPSDAPARPLASSPQIPVAAPAGSVLTQVDQIRHLSWEGLPIAPRSKVRRGDYSNAPRVKIRGVVTDSAGSCLEDATGGIEIWLHDQVASQAQTLGAYVEVEGRAILAGGHGATGQGPVIEVDHMRLLGNGMMPEPVRPSWSLLASGQMDAQWVEVDAVVRATDGSHLLLACESGQLTATIREAPALAVDNLLDASIRVRGVSLAATDPRGQMQGVELLVPSLQFIQTLQAPVDSRSLRVRKIGSLPQIRGPRELIHRVKVKGLLTCIDNNNYFIQDDSGAALAIAKEDVVLNLPAGGWWTFWQSPRPNKVPTADAALRVGDTVEVVGFPETRGYAPALTEATISKTDAIRPVLPLKATAEELGRGELDSSLVTLDGVALGSEALGQLLVLQIQSGLKTFRAILVVANFPDFHVADGARIRVTGVCQMEPASHAELGKRPADFTLRLRDPSDITLLALPPWLSLRRALAMVGALVVFLLAAFVWIRLLHRQVDQRTRQLEQKISEHERAENLLAGKTRLLQQEIEERRRVEAEVEKIHKQLLTTSRMAGMADVATNVLHNVGNVLNSVNVLAASIASHVKKSRVAAVSRVAALLSEHEVDLGRFMTDDPNGRHVPNHLERLGSHLTDEQARLLEKIKSLSQSIQHIKEIVAMQQNYAKVSGLRETVAIADIVEDALRMCSGALVRHEIEVARDYEEIPTLILDRHKTLQILFNLLDNAKHACWESRTNAKLITVTIRRREPDRVRIEIADNGVGIPPGNLNRIFTQGFSTRKDGHGFGLHSSILAAQDMGGSLAVRSNAPRPGATFTLEIPLTLSSAVVHMVDSEQILSQHSE